MSELAVVSSRPARLKVLADQGSRGETDEQVIKRRDDGSYLVSGWTPIDEFAEFMNFPVDDEIDYQTVAGLVLDELKHLPELGESFVKQGWQFEVIDLDGRRVDKVLVSGLGDPV